MVDKKKDTVINVEAGDTLFGGRPNIGSRVKSIEDLTHTILWVGVISIGAMILAAFGLFIEQLHFNNATYSQSYNIQSEQESLQSQISGLKHQIDTRTPQLSPIPQPSPSDTPQQ